MEAKPPVLVLGAGVIGLSVGVFLLEAGYPTTIWTKAIPPNVTSSIAGGLVTPFHAEPKDKVNRWTKETVEYYKTYFMSDSRCNYVLPRLSYDYFTNPTPEPAPWENVMPTRRPQSGELPKSYTDAYVTDAIILQTEDLLTFLLNRFRELDGDIVMKEIQDVQEAFAQFDIVCNCTGLGSKKLFNDDKMFPLRGQVLRVRHHGEPQVAGADEREDLLGYIIPRREDVILGGTLQKDNWSTDVDPKDTENILRNVKLMSPHFDKPEILEVKVGLRPGRTEVRLEPEEYFYRGKKKIVVHNYGHGGSGYTLCWGCAKDVLQLVNHHVKILAAESSLACKL